MGSTSLAITIQPSSPSIWEVIRLLSPSSIVSILNFLSTGSAPPYSIDVWKLIHSWTSVIIPLLSLFLLSSKQFSHCPSSYPPPDLSFVTDISPTTKTPSRKYLFLPFSLLSPLTIGTFLETYPIAQAIFTRLKFYKSQRIQAVPSAYQTLQTCLSQNRAQRFPKFDLYLPPPNINPTSGLFFLPGMLVDHTSYSPIAHELSQQGIVVVILRLEPLRIAAPGLGADETSMKQILNQLNSRFSRRRPMEWNIGGHSLGAYSALRLAKSIPTFHNIVLWGAGNLSSLLVDFHDEKRHVLVVNASNDGFVTFTKSQWNIFQSKLPPQNTKYVWIHGGNHAGFAHYEKNDLDGEETIPRDVQQMIACCETVKFLKRSKDKGGVM